MVTQWKKTSDHAEVLLHLGGAVDDGRVRPHRRRELPQLLLHLCQGGAQLAGLDGVERQVRHLVQLVYHRLQLLPHLW